MDQAIKNKVFLIFHWCCIFCSTGGFAQPQLVTNPSFEGLIPDTCANFTPNRIAWDRSTPSPDLFRACLPSSTGYSTPYTQWGYQVPRTGENFIGLQTFGAQGVVLQCGAREVAYSKLKKPLEKGNVYCVQFFVNLIDTLNTACNDIQAYFTVFPFLDNGITLSLCQVNPQVQNNPLTNPLTDQIGWTEVKGSFKANGNEEYIHLGNFKINQLSDTTNLFWPMPGEPFDGQSYYFIDDVTVTELRAFSRRDTFVCSASDFPLQISAYSGSASYLWNNGDTARSISIQAPGSYTVRMESPCGYFFDTLRVHIIDSLSLAQFVQDTLSACVEDFPISYTIPPLEAMHYQSFVWSNGVQGEVGLFEQAGIYTVEAVHECYRFTDTLKINALPSPVTDLPDDTLFCSGGSLLLQGYEQGQNLWSNGSTANSLLITEPGSYTLQATSNRGCISTDTCVVNMAPAIQDILPQDTILIKGEKIQLTLLQSFVSQVWDDGSTDSIRIINKAGLYHVRVTDAFDCVWHDSITISLSEPEPILPTFVGRGALWNIEYLKENSGLFIFNAAGQLVYASDEYENRLQNRFAPGVYLLRLTEPNGKQWIGKALVE